MSDNKIPKIDYYEALKKQQYYIENLEKKQYEAKEYLEQTLRHLKLLNKIIPTTKEEKDKIGKIVVAYINIYQEKIKIYTGVMNRFYKNNNKNYADEFYKMANKLEEIRKNVEEEISQLTLKYIKYFIQDEESIDIKL